MRFLAIALTLLAVVAVMCDAQPGNGRRRGLERGRGHGARGGPGGRGGSPAGGRGGQGNGSSSSVRKTLN